MKITNKTFTTIQDLEENLDLPSFNQEKILVQIFTGFVEEQEVKAIQAIIKHKNHTINFIGTTTAGEIFEGQALEKNIVISIIEFEDTTVKEGYFVDEDDFKLGITIGSELLSEDTKAMILFIDGLVTNGNDLIDGISSIDNTVPLTGGLAGEDGRLKNTYIFDQDGVYSKGCVAIALESKVLNVYTDYQLNWQAIGKTMTVTKAKKNRLYEVDNINASQIYTKYLGEDIGNSLPFSAVEFPLLKIEDDGLEICRTFVHQFDDGSLLTVGNLEVGDKVRFSFGNIDLILKSANAHTKKYASINPEVLFVYSCVARKSLLQSKVSQELLPLNNIAPNIGFFSYGEIYHKDNKVALLNESFTVLALSEKEQKETKPFSIPSDDKLQLDNFLKDKHFLILNALTNLSNTVITELEEAQKQLEDQSNRDFLTNLYNRRYFHEVSKDIINVSRREGKQSSLISMDIDKFKNINDTYGHDIGDKVIKALADILKQKTRKSDIAARFGGEEFILLLPMTDIEGAQKIAEKLRINVENTQVITDTQEPISFTISLGVESVHKDDIEIEDVLKRADKALYIAKESGRNRVVVASDYEI